MSDAEQSPYLKLLATLHDNFFDMKFVPSTKGRFIERLRKKLKDLSSGRSNEIVPGYMSEILKNMKQIP